MCHKPWPSPSFCACLCLFLISKAWSLWTICLKRTELCLHHAQRKATYEVYPSSLHPLCFSLYFTVGNKLNFRINSFFERPERVTLEGRQENRQLRSCSTSAGERDYHRGQSLAAGIPALPGPGFLLTACPCAEPGQGATWRELALHSLGRETREGWMGCATQDS